MPEMTLFCRRWHVSTDDFVYSGIKSVLMYTGGLAVVAIVYGLHKDEFALCNSGQMVRIYYIGMMVLLATHILISALLCGFSMQGAIIDGHKRWAVPGIIYAKGALFFPELAWLLLGTYWAFSGPSDCANHIVVLTVKVLVVIGWIMFLSLLIGILVVFDPMGHNKPVDPPARNRGSVSLFMDSGAASNAHKQLWERRCKLLCCCAASDENSKNAFNDIANLLTNFFKGLDLVPTDIAAGMILVQMNQHKAPRRLKRSTLVIQATPPPPTKASRRIFKRGKKRHKLEKAAANKRRPFEHTRSLDMEPPGGAGSARPLGPSRSLSMPGHVPDVLVNLSHGRDGSDQNGVLDTPKTVPGDVSEGNVVVKLQGDVEEDVDQRISSDDDEEVEVEGQPLPQDVPEPSGSGATCIAEENITNNVAPPPWMTIHNATHYMKYAMGSYGWPLYAYMNLPFGCCKLLCKCQCCHDHPSVHQDNCCNCNTTAINVTTGVHDDDMIYASFYNAIYEIPFYVVYDHSRSAIIVSIRGTLSLRDALTDLTAECEDMENQDVEAPCKAHKGITRAANYVHKVLMEKGILQAAFLATPNYSLVITGHSLGAGAAAVLSLLLRPTYPDLKCFAFSPPGGLLSLSLARYTQSFVCSVVLGYDLVPRLGIVSMEDLKTSILRCIKNCHKPKYKVFAGGVWHALFGLKKLEEEEILTRQPLLVDNLRIQMPCYGSQDNTTTERELEDAILCSGHSRMAHDPLYPPGQIIFIEEDEDSSTCCGVPNYHASWARPEVFDEIIVSPKMIMDHLPDVVFKSLMQLANRNFRIKEVVEVLDTEISEEVK